MIMPNTGKSTTGKSTGKGSAGKQGNNAGNFANDREKASEAGRKGGSNSRGGRS